MSGQELANKRWSLMGKFLSLFLICSVLASSCSKKPATESGSNSNSDRITIGTTLKIRTVDPADANEIAPLNLLYNLGDRLYTYSPGTTELKPQLATALPKISEDGLTYTIPLRQGVLFHDNTPFDAKAMAFSLQRFIKNGGRPAYLLGDIIASVEPSGKYELTIKLKQPFAAFPAMLTFSGACAVSPKAYEIGAGKFKPDTFIGTGPYKLAKYNTDSLRLEVFEQYWGEKPNNKGIDLQVLSSAANLFNSFQTGKIDIAYQSLDADQISSLQKNAATMGIEVITAKSSSINYLTLNIKSKPLDKLEVRQAIATMIDRRLLNERALQGQGEPLYSLIPTNIAAYKPTFQTIYGDANFSKAKEILTQAGYSKENPLKLQIWYATGSAKRSQIATTLKMLAQQRLDGILQLELNNVEGATIFQNLSKGIYPMVLLDWSPDYFDIDDYLNPFLGCAKGKPDSGCEEGESQSQGSFYYSDRANQLIKQERTAKNQEERQPIFGELQELAAKDVPYIPLWQDQDYVFVKKGIQGVKIEPTQQFPFWKIQKTKG